MTLDRLKTVVIFAVVFFFTNATAGINSRACAVLDKRLGIVRNAKTEVPPAEPVKEPEPKPKPKPEPVKKSQLEEFEYLKKEGANVGEDENGAVLIGFSMPASFAPGKSDLNLNAKMNLREIHKSLAPILEKYPEITLEINGYSDSVGSAKLNQKLSEERAFNVKLFFITQGVEPEKIAINGFGKEYSMFTNETEMGRSINRRVMIIAKREAPPKTEKAPEIQEAPKAEEEVEEWSGPKKNVEETKETEGDSTRNCIYIGVKAGFDMYKFFFGDSRDKHIKMGFGYGGGVSILFPISEDFTIRHEYNFGWRRLGSEDYDDDSISNGSPSEFVLGIFPIMLQYIPFKDLYFEMGPGLDIPILPKWTEKGKTRAYKDRANVDILIALGVGYYITEKVIVDVKAATSLTWVDAYERKTPFDRYVQFGLDLNYLFE